MAASDIPNPHESPQLQVAMRLSVAVGFLMLGTKVLAYGMTGSAAILADAAESVVHVVAVSFAAYSLWLSRKPPDPTHLYGHDKIAFFSAGFEGAMIVLAAVCIVYESIHRLIAGPKLENLGTGALLVLFAGLINGALGGYLVWASGAGGKALSWLGERFADLKDDALAGARRDRYRASQRDHRGREPIHRGQDSEIAYIRGAKARIQLREREGHGRAHG